MRVYATLALFKFNKGEMTKTIKNQIRQNILMASKDLIEVAAPLTPVDTGMARGSFLNLQALLGATGHSPDVDIPTTPQRKRKNGRALKYYHYDENRSLVGIYPKTPESARSLSTPREKILTEVEGQWKFTYETRVTHFNINDRSWQAFELGRHAMLEKMTSIQKKLPRIKSFILGSTLSGGRQNGYSYLEKNSTTRRVIS